MNRQAKSAIKSLVLTLRHKLEDDIGIQLKRYGFAGERWLPLDRLAHIQRDDQATIDHYRLKAALEQELRRMGVDPGKATPKQRAEAVDWFVREVSFTHLNRLVALKCLEVRDLILEIITTREAYGGRSRAHYDYRNAHPDEARGADDALPAAIRHVCRLISYFLLQALREKRDGILPLTPGTGQTTALDEIRRRMEAEFGEDAAFRMETEIKQVLGRGIADWLDGPFVKWHTKLYKRRPVIWHLSSPRKLFGCFVHYHKLDRDTLRKVQTLYLWPHRRAAEAELEAAQTAKATGERGAARRIDKAGALLDDLAEFEKRLLAVIQAEVPCDVPDWAEGPYRGGIYDPVLDDGVKVNIAPLQEGEVLRYRKVV